MGARDWVFATFVALFVSLGAYLYGYSIGSLNGLQNFSGFLEFFDLGNSSANSSCTEISDLMEEDQLMLGGIVTALFTGGGFGSLFSGKPADYFGRKVSLLVSGVLVVLGACIESAAVQGAPWMLLISRCIGGLGHGIFYTVGPLYIAEIAPRHIRGSLTSFIGPNIMMGLMTGYVTNILLYDKPFGWRVSRLLACVFACVYIVGMSFMPRTPRWLMLKGRESEARDVLRKTLSRRGQEAIEEELKFIDHLDSQASRSILKELKLLLKWKRLKRFMVGASLHVFTPICGNAVYVYSESLFCSLGILPFVTALVIGSMAICGTTFTTIFIDKLGRKPMMVGGGLVMGLLTGAAATLVYVFNLEEVDNQIVGYIVVSLVCLFAFVYSSTWYTIPYVVTSEIFPLEGRAVAIAISIGCNWITGLTFLQAFPSLLSFLHTFGVLYMISFINITAGMFYLFLLPETKGVSLEEMERVFSKPWLERVGLTCFFRHDYCRANFGAKSPPITNGQGADAVATDLVRQNSEENEHYKDWEEYWERYEVELKDGGPGKETTV